MNADFPYRFDGSGQTAQTTPEDHIRDLVEQVLFSAPGERVNRPEFGSGLQRLVFEPGGDTLAAALQASIQASLQRWLGELIAPETIEVESDGEGALLITVQYVVRKTRERRIEQFAVKGGSQ